MLARVHLRCLTFQIEFTPSLDESITYIKTRLERFCMNISSFTLKGAQPPFKNAISRNFGESFSIVVYLSTLS